MSFVNISFIYSLIFYLRWNPAVLSLTMHCCSLLISTSLIVLCLLLQPQSVPSLKCSIPSLPPPLLCLLPLSLPLCFPQFLSLLYPHHAPILSIFVLLCLSVPLFFSLSLYLLTWFTRSLPPSPPLPPLYPLSPLSPHVFHHHLSSSLSFTLVACFFQPFLTEKLREHTGLDRLWEGKARGTCEHHSQSRRMNNTSIVRSYFFKCMHTSKTCSKDVLSLSLSFTLSD